MPSVILGMLVDEYERLKRVLPGYQAKYDALPKGSLSIKKRGREQYAYRYYKERGRSKAQYVGPYLSQAFHDMREKLNESHYLLREIRDMKEQIADLEKAIRVLNRRKRNDLRPPAASEVLTL